MAAIVSCLAFSGLPQIGHAAGLGNITVFSLLGQPLRAEVEISATREELAGMKAQLASSGTFKQANVDYVKSLAGIKFSIDKRPNGQAMIKLKSDKPINEPFIDLLLELNWPTGHMMREYTFLLDPPELTAKKIVPVTPANLPSPQISSTASTATQALNQNPLDQPAGGLNSHEVKHGDSMRKIAGKTKPDGISLEQMLVGMWQANPKAFDGNNMNRLKVGQTLSIPDKAMLEAIASKDAGKIIAAQAADWNAYRQKLSTQAARGQAKEDVAQRDTAGRITAKVDDIAAPVTATNDQLKVSRTGAAGTNGGAQGKRSEEDRIAKERALQETNDRIASLEKNVASMQKLVEMKDQQLAALQTPMVAEPTTPITQPKPEQLASTAPAAAEPPLSTGGAAEMQLNQGAPKLGANLELTLPTLQEPLPEPSLAKRTLGNPLLLVVGALVVLLAFFFGYFLNTRRMGSQMA